MAGPQLAGPAASGAGGSGGGGSSAYALPLDRLVRKEVALGSIREKEPPQDHIGLQMIAPWLEVASDEVIFDYIRGGLQEGLSPARAEDAEAELSQKDDLGYGQGRASIIDWALKDKYTASDVTRYREALLISQRLEGTTADLRFNDIGRTVEDFNKRLARHDALRRKKLDNRMEWLIMQALFTGLITYNDGKVKFTVDFQRPGAQTNVAPTSGLWNVANAATADPIGDLLALNEAHFNTYGVYLKRAVASKKILNGLYKLAKFRDAFLFGMGVRDSGGKDWDPNYLGSGFGPNGARQLLSDQTGIEFVEYDSVYRTRNIGSQTFTNVRFSPDDVIALMPLESDLGEIDDTEIGFAKTLSAPHPEGDWAAGFYEWEDEKRDPWMHVRGSGVKAFPVFPYMEYTQTLKVL
jgi:hypothetical protein